MNPKTTLVLFLLVIVVVGVIFYLQREAPPPKPTVQPVPRVTGENVEQDLLPDFGDAVAITVAQPSAAEWRFERDPESGAGPQAGWRMVAPVEQETTDWQVSQIANRIKTLKYSVKYDSASDGMTAEQAGLDAPRAVVTLTDADDEQVTVEIGRNEGDRETYVRLGGAETIYRVTPSMKNLIKDRALAYREQQLFVIPPNSIVELAITDAPESGPDTTYRLIKSGTDWRFTEPGPAKAIADKIRTAANSFRSLRALEWVEQDVENLSAYGLDPAALSVTVTVEKPAPAPVDADSNGAAAAPIRETHTVHFSGISPLGEDNKVYVRTGTDRAVAKIMKTVADGLRPNLKEWRDNRLVEQDPARARRVTITVDDAVTRLERVGMSWTFADSGKPADRNEVRALLDAIKNAEALNFEAGAAADPARFGFDDPRGVVTLEPDGGATTRLTFGGFADAKTKRLVYVRVNDADSAIKLHVRDVNAILRKPEAFRDRTVAAVADRKLRAFTIDQTIAGNPVAVTVAKQGSAWRMTAPVDGAVDDAKVRAVVSLLGNLHAQRLIDRDPATARAAYGLENPPLRLTYTYQPDPIMQVTSNGVTPVDAEPQSLTVMLGKADDRVYAARGEDDAVIYEVDASVWTTLTAELRKGDLFNFDADQVTRVTWHESDDMQGFEKQAGRWMYVPESDIPINAQAVTTYLLRVRDLKVSRVVAYRAADLARYGLDSPSYRLGVTVDDQPLPELHVSSATDATGRHYAKSADANHVFLLPADTLARIRIDLAEFEDTTK
jgi:hypothetical protein